MTYSVVYDRLRVYLRNLGMDDGETPHSFRAGCAVALALSGSVNDVGQMMRHIGWFGEGSAEYYSRLPNVVESDFVAGGLAVLYVVLRRIFFLLISNDDHKNNGKPS